MASRNLVGTLIEAHLLDRGLTPEQFGDKVGLSGRTIRRICWPHLYGGPPKNGHHIDTKIRLARELREDPSTLWPPLGPKRIKQERRKVAA